jgi:hypothetical protein
VDALPENADDYWKLPQPKERGNSSPAEIHQAMGEALTTWEGIEYLFVTLFCHFVEGRPSNAAARAYGAISSSQGRMEALDNAAEVYFRIHKVADELKARFKFIRNHFDKARGRRNDIAHAVTMDFQFGGGDDAAGVFLIPAMYGSRKNFAFKPADGDRFSVLKSKYRLTAEDIRLMTTKFRQLEQALLRFHGDFAHAHPPSE